MMHTMLVLVFLVAGVFFLAVGSIGFIRLPDVFCRIHVTGVIDTMGAPLILLATAIYLFPDLVAGKLLLAVLFISVTSPLVAHMLARAALEAGHRPGVIEDAAALRARYGMLERKRAESKKENA
jgi:multicomponent Na+:H+ antiporter subunit G